MYATQNFQASRFSRFLFCALTGALFLLIPDACRADALQEGGRALARKFARELNSQGAFRISWQNESSLSNQQLVALREAFFAEMGNRRVAGAENTSVPFVQIFIREAPARLLLIADIAAGTSRQVRIVELPRAELNAKNHNRGGPHLRNELLWEQTEPIAAAAEYANPGAKEVRLLILGRESLSTYRQADGNWVLQTSAPVRMERSWKPTRDTIARISFPSGQAERFQIFYQSLRCDGVIGGNAPVQCNPEASAWWLAEGIGLAPGCGGPSWWLVPGRGDRTVPDELTLKNSDAAPDAAPSAAVNLPGHVLSLSQGSSGTADAVVFNLSTGNYEVYRITVACGD